MGMHDRESSDDADLRRAATRAAVNEQVYGKGSIEAEIANNFGVGRDTRHDNLEGRALMEAAREDAAAACAQAVSALRHAHSARRASELAVKLLWILIALVGALGMKVFEVI